MTTSPHTKDEAYRAGKMAGASGYHRNPYPEGTALHDAWKMGHREGGEMENEKGETA